MTAHYSLRNAIPQIAAVIDCPYNGERITQTPNQCERERRRFAFHAAILPAVRVRVTMFLPNSRRAARTQSGGSRAATRLRSARKVSFEAKF